MKIRSIINVQDGAYAVQVGVEELTPLEQQLLAQFGQPDIAVGGAFSGSATRPGDGDATAASFTLPAETRRLPSGFPVKQVFALADYEDADIRAVVFQTTIHSRITAAHTALKAQSAHFAGETLTTVL